MKVFKFGGASVNSAAAVKNMTGIIRGNFGEPLVVVISAMGKTTNLLEKLVPQNGTLPQNFKKNMTQLSDYHENIINDLFGDKAKPVAVKFGKILEQLKNQIFFQKTRIRLSMRNIIFRGI